MFTVQPLACALGAELSGVDLTLELSPKIFKD